MPLHTPTQHADDEGRESDSPSSLTSNEPSNKPSSVVRIRGLAGPPRPSRRRAFAAAPAAPPEGEAEGPDEADNAADGDDAAADGVAAAEGFSTNVGDVPVTRRSGVTSTTRARAAGARSALLEPKSDATIMGSASRAPHAARPEPEGRAPAGAGVPLGTTIEGRYVIEELIGGGNIGLVYRAKHKVIGKTVAVKLLRLDFSHDHEVSERFLVEARAASGVDNPHVVDISDFGALPDGTAYFVMEYLDGRPLSRLIRAEAPLPHERIVRIGKQIAAGVGAAHKNAIVHRDLKPDNLLLTKRGHEEDFVTVVDFGIAKVTNAANRLTVAGTLYGTPHYMSPEQGRGDEVDPRSDIYSLGVILYEMATGRVPFDAESPFTVVSLHVNAEPVPPHLVHPETGVSVALSEVIVKCLAKDPADRYRSMAELAADLDRTLRLSSFDSLSDEPTTASLPDAPAASAHKPSKARWPLALSGAFALALAFAASYQRTQPAGGPAEALAPAAAAPAAAAPAPAAAPPQASDDALRGATEVALVISPIDAHVFHQKVDLGAMPISIPVPSGDTVEVEIKRDGFLPKKVRLDGSLNKRVVRLLPLVTAGPSPHQGYAPEDTDKGESSPKPAPAPTSAPAPKPASALEAGGLEDVPINWPADAAEPGGPSFTPPR